MAYNKVFSDYEVEETAIKFEDDEAAAEKIGCTGSSEETLDTFTVTKKCGRKVLFKKTRGAGTGNVKMSVHMKYDAFVKSLGMVFEEHKAGVYSYGEKSEHKTACITQKVLDEEGNVKYKAYPKAQIEEGIARKIENGSEDVTALELTLSLSPDEYGQCMYEAIASELEGTDLADSWMTAFDSSATYVSEA